MGISVIWLGGTTPSAIVPGKFILQDLSEVLEKTTTKKGVERTVNNYNTTQPFKGDPSPI